MNAAQGDNAWFPGVPLANRHAISSGSGRGIPGVLGSGFAEANPLDRLVLTPSSGAGLRK